MALMNIIVIGVWAGYIRQNHPDFMPVNLLIVNIVSVAIAFVPEGLPIALTASLTIVANVMRKNNILCKSLKTVETLGAVSVLLSDKTGTLTKNQMVVTDCLVGFSTLTADEAQLQAADESPEFTWSRAALDQLIVVSAVCNAGEFDPLTINLPLAQRRIIGDATDQAVLRFSESLAPVVQSRDLWRKRFDLAFNSKNKFALKVLSPMIEHAVATTLPQAEANLFNTEKDLLLMIKGAPDVLITRCTKYVGEDGHVYNLDEGVRASIEAVKDKWSSQGKRVLLLARKVLPASTIRSDPNDGEFESEAEQQARTDLTLVALVCIVDPPRDEIREVIDTLRRAGIRTMMVTGDFKLTAQAIARSCDMITTDDPSQIHSVARLARSPDSEKPTRTQLTPQSSLVISGPELASLTTHQWDVLTTYPSLVFARTTPDQKLRIVREFRSRGYVTGMTGDGVNDAPSLKEADIGIAAGSGSDIALAAADMVLLDSFSAIIPAVTYGRVVFDNLKKTITYLLLAGSFSEFWPVMTSVIFGLPQVLSSFLMIIICCFTDCVAACALACEKPEANVMSRPPRNIKTDRLVDWKLLAQSYGLIGTIETTASFAMSFWYLQRKGIPFSELWFSFGDFSNIGHDSKYISHHLAVASAIYFVNLVVMQWFNLMAIRTRHLSIFSHPPVGKKETRNILIFPAIVFALAIAFIFCHIPGLQGVATSAQVPVEYWFFPVAFGLGLLTIDEGRKAAVRRWPGGWVAKCAW
jgi:sodium/potassium-transporting ATPase subunit alpha